MATRNQIIKALKERLSDLDADALEQTPAGRVIGVVISERFEDQDDEERQRLLWEILDQAFSPDELRNVGPIVTMTFPETVAHQMDAD